DHSGNNAMDYAASRGLSDTVTFLLARTNGSDTRHYMEYAALIRAVYANDPNVIPVAGKGGLESINRLTPDGGSPLHIAASNGAVEMMKALIAHGADVNLENSSHQTPLQWAAWNNRADGIALLVDKGAEVNRGDLVGNTPLMLAAENRAADAIKMLL